MSKSKCFNGVNNITDKLSKCEVVLLLAIFLGISKEADNSDQWMILVVLVFVRNQSNELVSVLSMTWIPTSFFFPPTFLQYGSKTENRTLYHRALFNTFCWGNVLENWLLAYSRCTNKNCLVIRSWYNKNKPFFVTNWTVTIKYIEP